MDVFELQATIKLDTGDYDSKISDAEGKATGLSNTFGSKLGTAGKVAGVAVAAVGTAVVAAGGAFVKSAGQVAEYGDHVDKMSQKMGMSANAYQEWDAIMQHCGSSIDALKPSMKTLANQAQKGSDAFQKLGISEQEVATLSQEDLFSRVITGLQGMEEGTERTAITSELLGRGATELGALLNTSAEDTEKMRQAVHDLGGVMGDDAVKAAAAYQDQLQDMQTAFGGLKRNLMSEFLPSITQVMEGLTNIFSGGSGIEQITEGINGIVTGITNALPKVMETGSQILGAIAEAILANLPAMIDAGMQTVMSLIQGLVNALPQIANTAIQIIAMLAQGIGNALPQLIPAAAQAIVGIVQGLIQNMPLLIQAAVQLVTGLAQGLVAAIPVLLEAAPQLIGEFVAQLIANAPLLIECALQLVMALASGLIAAIPELIAAIPQLLMAIANTFLEYDWATLGQNILEGLKGGLEAAVGTVIEAATSVAQAVIDAFKSLFGIASPSTVMNEQGLMLVEGLIQGIINMPARVAEVFSQVLQTVLQWFQNIIQTGVQKATEFVSNVISRAAQLPSQLLSAISPAIQNVIQWGSQIVTNATAKISETVSKVVSHAKQLPSQFLGAINPAIQNVISWGSQLVSNARAKVSEMGSQMISAASGIPSQFMSIGRNIISSLISGIGSMVGSLYSSIHSALSGLVGRAKSALGIGSPSKVFKAIGNFTAQGFEIGWKDRFKQVRMSILNDMESLQYVEGEVPTAKILNSAKADIASLIKRLKTDSAKMSVSEVESAKKQIKSLLTDMKTAYKEFDADSLASALAQIKGGVADKKSKADIAKDKVTNLFADLFKIKTPAEEDISGEAVAETLEGIGNVEANVLPSMEELVEKLSNEFTSFIARNTEQTQGIMSRQQESNAILKSIDSNMVSASTKMVSALQANSRPTIGSVNITVNGGKDDAETIANKVNAIIMKQYNVKRAYA